MFGRSFVFDTGAATHEGRVRSFNEDRILVQPQAGLWLVADGMGGHKAGDVASSFIAEQLATMGISSSSSDQHARFVDRLNRANQSIRDYSHANAGLTVGSTVAAVLIFEDQYRSLWVGDSRVYLVRSGVIQALSRDHSEVQELIDQGILSATEALTFSGRNVITRAVGVNDRLDIDMTHGIIASGDCFIICSDGLTAHCSDEDIGSAVQGRMAQSACDALVQMALERGGTDNVSVVVVHCRSMDLTVPLSDALFFSSI